MNTYSRKIPVIIVAGFLGAGKTTLLNYLLKQSLGMRIGVIVNDFGAVNIDAMLIGRQAEGKIEMSNGCICCTLEDGDIANTLSQLAYKDSDIDAIVIEASGIAEPAEVAFLLQASGNKYIEPSGIVYVVDVAHYQQTLRQHEEIAQHIKAADMLVLNKIDTMDGQDASEVEAAVRILNHAAPIIKTSNGRIDPKILFDIKQQQSIQLSLAHISEVSHEEHLHTIYASTVFETDKSLDPKLLQDFLKNPPEGVYRVKGFAYFGMKGLEQRFVIHKVGKQLKMHAEEWEDLPKTQLVIIGVGVSEEVTRCHLEQCIDATPDALTNDTMLNLLDYRNVDI